MQCSNPMNNEHKHMSPLLRNQYELKKKFSSIHSKSILTLTTRTRCKSSITSRDPVCCAGVWTRPWPRGDCVPLPRTRPLLPPRHQPGLNHEQEMPNCRLDPSRRNISRHQTPHSATVQYIEISTYLYIYATPESGPVRDNLILHL